MFQIDLRSLALLRILVGLVVIGQLVTRWADLTAFYGDTGVLPIELARQLLGSNAYWSLYWQSNDANWVSYLWTAQLVFALGVTFGFQTRFCLLGCLVLLWSMQVRNIHVLTAGDILLRLQLIWLWLLPSHHLWSLDAYLRWVPKPQYVVIQSWATAGLMLQLAAIYFFAGLAKLNEYWWNGTAVAYSLQLEMFVSSLGRMLLAAPVAMNLATWITLAIEVLGPLLLFSPWRTQYLRGFLMATFWLLHINVWLTMSVGWFSPVAIVAWVIFLPSELWGRVGLTLSQNVLDPSRRHWQRSAMDWIAIALIIHMVLINSLAGLPNTGLVAMYRLAAVASMTVQEFRMFAQPPLYSPTFEYRATLLNGKRVDLFTGEYRSLEAPPARLGYAELKNHAWRRYHASLVPIPFAPIAPKTQPLVDAARKQLLDYFVRQWNDAHSGDERVQEARLICWIRPLQATSSATEYERMEWCQEVYGYKSAQ